MELAEVTPAAMLTLAGASIVVSILVGAVIAAWKPTSEQKDRFGPILAIVIGIVTVGVFAVLQNADLASAILTGLIAGAGSMGVHDTVDAVTGT